MGMCFVPDCKHYSERDTCKFFRFPKEQITQKKWIKLIGRGDSASLKNARVCSCHFKDSNRNNLPVIFKRNETKLMIESPPERSHNRNIVTHMEILSTLQNKPCIAHDGYLYEVLSESYLYEVPPIVWWKCLKAKSEKCSGRLKTDLEYNVLYKTPHVCEPNKTKKVIEKNVIKTGHEKFSNNNMENSSNGPPVVDPQYSDSSMTAGPTIVLDSIKSEVILPDDYDGNDQQQSHHYNANDQQHTNDYNANDHKHLVPTSVATPVAAAPPPSLPVTVPSLITLNSLPKRPRITPPCDTLQTTTTVFTKDHHPRIPYNRNNSCVPPQSVQGTSGCDGNTLTTNSSEDRFDVFGKMVACKLRDMDKTQRILVEKIINDALFEGEMGLINKKLVDMPQLRQYKPSFLAI